MQIASRMAITQFIGGQAVVLAGSTVLDAPGSAAPAADRPPAGHEAAVERRRTAPPRG